MGVECIVVVVMVMVTGVPGISIMCGVSLIMLTGSTFVLRGVIMRLEGAAFTERQLDETGRVVEGRDAGIPAQRLQRLFEESLEARATQKITLASCMARAFDGFRL